MSERNLKLAAIVLYEIWWIMGKPANLSFAGYEKRVKNAFPTINTKDAYNIQVYMQKYDKVADSLYEKGEFFKHWDSDVAEKLRLNPNYWIMAKERFPQLTKIENIKYNPFLY